MIENSTQREEQNGTNVSSCIDGQSILISPWSCKSIVDVYLVTIYCIIGVLGNAVTIAVLQKDKDKKNTTNWLLQMLAIVDSMLLVFAFVFPSMITLSYTKPNLIHRRKLTYLLPYLWPIGATVQIIAIWNVVLVTADRYLAICKPLHPEWRSLRRVKVTMLVVVIIATIYSIPLYFEFIAEKTKYCDDEEYEYNIMTSSLLENPGYKYTYGTVRAIVHQIGPFIIIVILNIFIALKLKSLNKKRREMTTQVKEEGNVTLMLIISVTVFVLCQFPSCGIYISTLYNYIFCPMQFIDNSFYCAADLCNSLVVLNSSINFIIYCLVWKKFNTILIRMMKCEKVDEMPIANAGDGPPVQVTCEASVPYI